MAIVTDLDRALNAGNSPTVFETDIVGGLQGLVKASVETQKKVEAKHQSKKFFGYNLDVEENLKIEELEVLTSPSFVSALAFDRTATKKVFSVKVYIPELFGCFPFFSKSELYLYQALKRSPLLFEESTDKQKDTFFKVRKRLKRFPTFYVVNPKKVPSYDEQSEVEVYDMNTMYFGRYLETKDKI
jgi:hypothetical protein